ncbi:MAG: hypothetical protein PS018_15190 [bacterium]|nr:hypothetical protein [bacterium]
MTHQRVAGHVGDAAGGCSPDLKFGLAERLLRSPNPELFSHYNQI